LCGAISSALDDERKFKKLEVTFNDGRLFIRGVTKGKDPRRLGPLMPLLAMANAFKD